MGSDSLFSRSNKESGDDDTTEGVRIIKPDEAAEAVERGDAVKRKGDDQPKYGDRPPSPPDDVRPAMRFPLPDSAATPPVRPRVAPVDPRAGHEPQRPDEPPADEPQRPAEPPADEPQRPAQPRADEPPAREEPPARRQEPPAAQPEHARPPEPTPERAPEPASELDSLPIVAREDLGLPVEEPIISVEPSTGETELPHWTAPATGEVPKVIIGEADDEELDEQARWSSFAASTGPRWRDEHDDWEDTGDVAALAEPDAVPGVGALDMTERPSQEEFLSFDDLEVPTGDAGAPLAPEPAEPEPTAPIRIGSGTLGPQPAAPRTEAAPPTREARPRRPAAGAEPARGAPRTRPAPEGRRAGGGGGDGGDASQGAPRDVPLAVIVGVAIGAVAIIAFSIDSWAAMVLVEVVVALAGAEFFGALRRSSFRPATLLGLTAIASLPLAAYWRGEAAIPMVLVLTLVFTLLWFMLGVGGTARPTPNTAITFLGVVYVGVLGSFAALILGIPEQGVSILLVAIVSGVFYDVGGFFVGQRMGKTPLTAISPHKTWEGLAGGAIASLVAVFVTTLWFGPFSTGEAFLFWLATATAAFFGDLAESLFKRDLGLKDMGSLLPGHGGVLDRFDGMLFVLPAAYYFVRLFDVVPGL